MPRTSYLQRIARTAVGSSLLPPPQSIFATSELASPSVPNLLANRAAPPGVLPPMRASSVVGAEDSGSVAHVPAGGSHADVESIDHPTATQMARNGQPAANADSGLDAHAAQEPQPALESELRQQSGWPLSSQATQDVEPARDSRFAEDRQSSGRSAVPLASSASHDGQTPPDRQPTSTQPGSAAVMPSRGAPSATLLDSSPPGALSPREQHASPAPTLSEIRPPAVSRVEAALQPAERPSRTVAASRPSDRPAEPSIHIGRVEVIVERPTPEVHTLVWRSPAPRPAPLSRGFSTWGLSQR